MVKVNEFSETADDINKKFIQRKKVLQKIKLFKELIGDKNDQRNSQEKLQELSDYESKLVDMIYVSISGGYRRVLLTRGFCGHGVDQWLLLLQCRDI